MKKTVLLLLLLTAFSSFCQITYQPGYFINNSGAKTNCLIKNIAWKDNPTRFDYKLTETGDALTADINDVTEFNVSGYKFLRYTVNIDRSVTDLDYLSSVKDPEFKTETLFLKVLTEGHATLYQYEDNNLVRYFYTAEGMPVPEQLIYKDYLENGAVAHNNQFRGQLFSLMKTRLTDPDRFKNIRYQKEPLIKVFLEYGGNKDEAVNNVSESQNKTSVNIKFTPGVNFASLSLAQKSSAIPSGIDFNAVPVLRIGFEAELVLPFNNNKWALFADLNFQAFKKEGIGSNKSSANPGWKVDYKFFEIPVGVRHYMYLNKKAKIFLNIAYSLVINAGKPKLSYGYTVDHTNYNIGADIANSSGLSAGIGLNYSRYSAEIRYNFSRELLPAYANWASDYKSIGIILGYKLF